VRAEQIIAKTRRTGQHPDESRPTRRHQPWRAVQTNRPRESHSTLTHCLAGGRDSRTWFAGGEPSSSVARDGAATRTRVRHRCGSLGDYRCATPTRRGTATASSTAGLVCRRERPNEDPRRGRGASPGYALASSLGGTAPPVPRNARRSASLNLAQSRSRHPTTSVVFERGKPVNATNVQLDSDGRAAAA
jgi:hypothetical protein